jgi:hypothetical protein
MWDMDHALRHRSQSPFNLARAPAAKAVCRCEAFQYSLWSNAWMMAPLRGGCHRCARGWRRCPWRMAPWRRKGRKVERRESCCCPCRVRHNPYPVLPQPASNPIYGGMCGPHYRWRQSRVLGSGQKMTGCDLVERGALRCASPFVYSAGFPKPLSVRTRGGEGRGEGGWRGRGISAPADPRFNLRDQMCGRKGGAREVRLARFELKKQAEASTYLLAPTHRDPRRTLQRASMCTPNSGRIRASLYGAPKRT